MILVKRKAFDMWLTSMRTCSRRNSQSASEPTLAADPQTSFCDRSGVSQNVVALHADNLRRQLQQVAREDGATEARARADRHKQDVERRGAWKRLQRPRRDPASGLDGKRARTAGAAPLPGVRLPSKRCRSRCRVRSIERPRHGWRRSSPCSERPPGSVSCPCV